MLEGLSDSLSQTMKKLAGMSIIDKQTLKEVTKIFSAHLSSQT